MDEIEVAVDGCAVSGNEIEFEPVPAGSDMVRKLTVRNLLDYSLDVAVSVSGDVVCDAESTIDPDDTFDVPLNIHVDKKRRTPLKAKLDISLDWVIR